MALQASGELKLSDIRDELGLLNEPTAIVFEGSTGITSGTFNKSVDLVHGGTVTVNYTYTVTGGGPFSGSIQINSTTLDSAAIAADYELKAVPSYFEENNSTSISWAIGNNYRDIKIIAALNLPIKMSNSYVNELIGTTSGSEFKFSDFYGAELSQTITFGPNRAGSYVWRRFVTTSGPNASTTNAFNYSTSSSTSFAPSGDGSVSADAFMGQTTKKWTSFMFFGNPGGQTIIIGAANNPHSTSSSNSGWNTMTFSAYGQSGSTTKTWTSTITRAGANYSSDTNITKPGYQGSTVPAYGYNDRWWWRSNQYGDSFPYTGDNPFQTLNAAVSSANNGNGITITNT
jgi:hypothetical protein